MQEKRAKYLLVALIGLYLILFGWFTLERHQRLETSVFDMGIFDQAMYLLSHGNSHFLTTRGLHIQADHFHPALYLLAPLYLIYPSVSLLLLAQTLIVGLGAYPAFRIARRHGLKPEWSLLIALAYLTHPAVSFLNRFEFHPVCMMMTALMFSVMYLEEGKPWPYAVSLVLALACTEAAGFTVVAMVLTALLVRGWRWAAGTAALGVGGMVAAKLSLRHFNRGLTTPYAALYTEYGQSELEIVRNLLAHPVESLRSLATPLNLEYLTYLFAPFLLLPLLGPGRLVPALPTLMGNLLSWRYSQHRVEYHYGAALAPFLLWAMVVGWRRVEKRGVPSWVLASLLSVSVVACIIYGPEGFKHTDDFGKDADLSALRKTVRPDDSVSADGRWGAQLSERQEIYLFPNPFLTAAWSNSTAALLQQAGAEYRPFERGTIRRGLESAPTDLIVLPVEGGRRSDFPLRPADSLFARLQVIRSRLYEKQNLPGEVEAYRRRGKAP